MWLAACTGRRHTSTVANAAFSSYFFHNSQWLSSKSTTPSRPQLLRLNQPVSPRVPTSAFKKVEISSPSQLLGIYAQLSKPHLSILVCLTAMGGVALSPLPTTVPTLLSTAVGTALCASSANAFNMLQEVPFDAQMARTRSRPLVRKAISPLHATMFAVATGVAGPVLLWTMVNPATAILGLSNIVLYAGIYTWMKRKSIWNTWVGSIVGALPPAMGWTACGGQLFPSVSSSFPLFLPEFLSSSPVDISVLDSPLAPFVLPLLLFSWQFPHFNSLSYFVRGSYAQAGYRMLSVLDPQKNALVALRHAILLTSICSILVPLSGLTTWAFALTSLPPNLVCVQAAWKWWRQGGEKQARVVFRHSLWYLPLILGLMMVHKQGVDWLQWIGVREKKEIVDTKLSLNAVNARS
ncbi:protoheme IX farnesyltransferase [Desarmillaria ectypa]|nr:protoheme IX farnesyltransferase [Desarmillaria ectypa]